MPRAHLITSPLLHIESAAPSRPEHHHASAHELHHQPRPSLRRASLREVQAHIKPTDPTSHAAGHHIHITPAPHRECSVVTSRAPPRVRSRDAPPTTSKPAPSALEKVQPHQSAHIPAVAQEDIAPPRPPSSTPHTLAHGHEFDSQARTYLRCGRESTVEITTSTESTTRGAWARGRRA